MKLENIGFYTLSDDRIRNVSITSPVYRSEFLIIDSCNFKCPYCRGSNYGRLSLDSFKESMDLLRERGLKNIRFSGGEPTLNPDLLKMVEISKNVGVERLAVSTNGSSDMELYKNLISAGLNNFSISLDACCSSYGKKMLGGIDGMWEKVVENIKEISKLTYVTVGCVFTEETVDTLPDVVHFAHDLGVADIRIISSAQYNENFKYLNKINVDILDKHPILKYRVENSKLGIHVRGLCNKNSKQCALVLDDLAIAGGNHYPCIIYMREGGRPIGKIGKDLWNERLEWFNNHDCQKDGICNKNCLDVCIDYNNRYFELKENL